MNVILYWQWNLIIIRMGNVEIVVKTRILSFWDMMLHQWVTRPLLGHLDQWRWGHCIVLEYQDLITCWCIIISSTTLQWKTQNSWLITFINMCVREFTVNLTVQHTKPKVPEGKQKHFMWLEGKQKHFMWLEVTFLTNDNEKSFKGWIFHISSTVQSPWLQMPAMSTVRIRVVFCCHSLK